MRQVKYVAMVVLAASTLGACATKGFVRKGLEEQRVALSSEKTERVAGDAALRTDVNGLRTDVNGLRTDLNALRTVGYGKARLVRPGAQGTADGAELNRRVTFVIETPAGAATVAALSGLN